MKILLYDLKTKLYAIVTEEDKYGWDELADRLAWDYSDGNWSCDCNRARHFTGLYEELTDKFGENICFQNHRIIVADIDFEVPYLSKEELIKEMNWGYEFDAKLLQSLKKL
jgi:hypothetical protein